MGMFFLCFRRCENDVRVQHHGVENLNDVLGKFHEIANVYVLGKQHELENVEVLVKHHELDNCFEIDKVIEAEKQVE